VRGRVASIRLIRAVEEESHSSRAWRDLAVSRVQGARCGISDEKTLTEPWRRRRVAPRREESRWWGDIWGSPRKRETTMVDQSGSDKAEKQQRSPWVWKWTRRVLAALGCVFLAAVVLTAGVALYLGHRARASAREVLSEMEQRGLPTRMSSVSFPNEGLRAAKEAASYFIAAGNIARRASWPPFIAAGNVPWPPRDILDPLEIVLGAEIDSELAADLEEYVTRQREIYQLVELGRNSKAHFYDLELDETASSDNDILFGLRYVALMLEMLSLSHQARGNGTEALRPCTAMLEISESLQSEPSVLTWFCRRYIDRTASDQIEQTLSRTIPDAESLYSLRSRCLTEVQNLGVRPFLETEIALIADNMQHPKRYGSHLIWQGERALASGAYAEAEMRWLKIRGTSQFPSPRLPSEASSKRRLNLYRLYLIFYPDAWKSSFATELRTYVRFYDSAGQNDQELAEMARKVVGSGKELMPSVESSTAMLMLEILCARAQMRVTAIALSVELYYRDHDRWPSKLSELNIRHLDDPLGRGSIKYRHTEDGCKIYSVGRNGADDMGNYYHDLGLNRDDIVFRLFDKEKRGTLAPGEGRQDTSE